MKTQGLKQALNKYGFDAAFGGARRDEEKSRAKVALHDGVAEGYLAVTTDHDLAVAAYGYDCSHAQLLVGCGGKSGRIAALLPDLGALIRISRQRKSAPEKRARKAQRCCGRRLLKPLPPRVRWAWVMLSLLLNGPT